MMTLLQSLQKNTSHRKAIYFLWKNKIKSQRADHTKYTEQEFIDKFCNGKPTILQGLRAWEKTEQYASFVNLMLYDRMGIDFLEIYEAITEKAKKGDSQAVKTFLLLQKEVKANMRKQLKKKPDETDYEDDQDDELILE